MESAPDINLAEYWNYPPTDKFQFFEDNYPDGTPPIIIRPIYEEAVSTRKVALWKECKKKCVKISDLIIALGGNEGNVRRNLNAGKNCDAYLVKAIQLADLDPKKAEFSPNDYHFAVAKTYMIGWLRHAWHDATELKPWHIDIPANLPPEKFREPAQMPTFEQGLLLQTLFSEELVENWLRIAVINDCAFNSVLDSAEGQSFLKKLYMRTRALLDDAPEEDQSKFDCCCPEQAGLAASLKTFVLGWNDYQLYAMAVHDAFLL